MGSWWQIFPFIYPNQQKRTVNSPTYIYLGTTTLVVQGNEWEIDYIIMESLLVEINGLYGSIMQYITYMWTCESVTSLGVIDLHEKICAMNNIILVIK